MDDLWGLYEHWCMEELISLREFVMRLKTGEFSTFNRAEVVDFLREIEASMLENIELKALENPLLEELKEERMAETSQEIDELIAEWEHGWQCVWDALTPLTDADLQRIVMIRSEPHTVYKAISRQVAHYAGHAYQILLLAKHMSGPNWKTLSIPRGQSEEFNRRMIAKLKAEG